MQLRQGYTPSELLSTYNKSSTDSGFNAKYDVNTDKIVNKPDYLILNTVTTPSPTPIPTPSSPQPDLVINKISVSTPRVRRRSSISIEIQNTDKGYVTANSKINAAVSITKPDGISLGTCSGILKVGRRGLKSQGKMTIQAINCPKFTIKGNHTITATVDSTNVVSESNENNNQLSTTVNVR